MLVLKTIDGVRKHFLFRLPEWMLAAELAAFAGVLIAPADTFASSRSYDVLAAIASERVWGAFIGAVAALRLIALTLNGTFPRFSRVSPLARSVCAALSGFIWFTLALGFYKANPAGTGWGTYAICLLADLFLAMSVAGEAGAAWRRQHHGGA